MMFARFIVDLLAACVLLMLLGWTVDLLIALREVARQGNPAGGCGEDGSDSHFRLSYMSGASQVDHWR